MANLMIFPCSCCVYVYVFILTHVYMKEKMIGKNCNKRQGNAILNKMQEAIVKSQSNRYLLDYTAFPCVYSYRTNPIHTYTHMYI